MSLNLHEKCKSKLIEVLAELLPKLIVSNNFTLDRKSSYSLLSAESVVSGRGEDKDKLVEFIDEAPIFHFIHETLARELSENQEYNSEAEDKSLIEISGYKDPTLTATRLIEELDSLPWRYIFTVKFDREVSEKLFPIIKIHKPENQIGIIKTNNDFIEKFPLVSGIETRDNKIRGPSIASALLGLRAEPEWGENQLCLQIEHEGFIGHFDQSATFERALNDFKAFCGLTIALRILKIDRKYRPTPIRAKFIIHKLEAEKWVVQRFQEFDADVSETFHDLVPHDLDGTLDTEEKRINWVNFTLLQIKRTFNNRDQNKNILLAAQWLFDSYCGKNQLLSYIQMIVVLEILLGDKASSNQVGLGVLLGNRCAYLIGHTKTQRDEILKDFKEIYDVRSKIVHRGKSKLNAYEFSLFRKLQWMCRRIIQKEIELLDNDLKK
ncbi:MAG: hypothetical protein COA45_03920 [Zetaproteobacteria bacterium]|nr:MAG: hypothetical protein COA45_03920 [Zetaproteobacteria bacterium]